jgi:hypothetical protein
MNILAVILGICFCGTLILQGVFVQKLMYQNQQLAKLLASRSISEYSLAEARIAKASAEQKPDQDETYSSAWDSEDTIHG